MSKSNNIKITGWGLPGYFRNKSGDVQPKERKRYDEEFGWKSAGMFSASDKIKEIVKKAQGNHKKDKC